MGAISGISDVQNEAVAGMLIAGYPHYTAGNQKLAIAALLRHESRCIDTLDALASDKLPSELRTAEVITVLRKHSSATVRQRAMAVLGQ